SRRPAAVRWHRSGSAAQDPQGQGFYKIPSLRGAWYRPRLLRDGSLADLEETAIRRACTPTICQKERRHSFLLLPVRAVGHSLYILASMRTLGQLCDSSTTRPGEVTAGKNTVNVAPCPGVLCTCKSPLLCLTMP